MANYYRKEIETALREQIAALRKMAKPMGRSEGKAVRVIDKRKLYNN